MDLGIYSKLKEYLNTHKPTKEVPSELILMLKDTPLSIIQDQWNVILENIGFSDEEYIRVGCDYYKVLMKSDYYGIKRRTLKSWKVAEIERDYPKKENAKFWSSIEHYDDFIIEPDNVNFTQVIDNCYNLYAPFVHVPKEGNFDTIKTFMEHIFGNQLELGYRYFQCLYLHPKHILPILALVSKERQTGKTTFISFLNAIFGNNTSVVSSKDLTRDFNDYLKKNIIVIEETNIAEKASTIEKLKSISTGGTMTVNEKFVHPYSLPIYSKIIITSNFEDSFAKIDKYEIRYFVRKLKPIEKGKFDGEFLNKLISEIPAFLQFLKTMTPVNFNTDRSGFTPSELNNEYLESVKENSESWLCFDFKERMTAFFSENPSFDVIYASASDIKNRFYLSNNNVSGKYIRDVLVKELEIEKPDKYLKKYKEFEECVISKAGRPYAIKKDVFICKSGLNENYPDYQVTKETAKEDMPF